MAPVYFAVSELLSDNPEDSVEMKRSTMFMQRFQAEVAKCKEKRKAPLAGQDIHVRPASWNWLSHMDFYSNLP